MVRMETNTWEAGVCVSTTVRSCIQKPRLIKQSAEVNLRFDLWIPSYGKETAVSSYLADLYQTLVSIQALGPDFSHHRVSHAYALEKNVNFKNQNGFDVD